MFFRFFVWVLPLYAQREWRAPSRKKHATLRAAGVQARGKLDLMVRAGRASLPAYLSDAVGDGGRGRIGSFEFECFLPLPPRAKKKTKI